MGKLISFEGISGVGKSFYLNKIKSLKPGILTLREITDVKENNITKKIFDILSVANNKFFDNGLPKTETSLLFSKLIYETEKFIEPALKKKNAIIISDRNIDTVCIYQAVIISYYYGGDALEIAKNLFDSMKPFVKVPDITILFVDEFEKSISRAEKRDDDKYSKDELKILKAAEALYTDYAKLFPERFIVIKLQDTSTDEVTANVLDIVEGAYGR